MTKIDIISGFLGAGKTTLIKKLVKESLESENIVIIENEFGEIGIDGGFLKDAGIKVTEMNSGCICCSLVGDFGIALKKVLDEYSPDRIIIEPSGVGKLSDVINAVKGIDSDCIELNSFTAVVDAKKCKIYHKNFGEFFNNQIQSAKTVILSHTNDISEDKLQKCLDIVSELNKDALVVTTDWEKLTGDRLLSAMEKGGKDITEMINHHHHDEHCTCGCHEHDHDEHEHHGEHEHHHGEHEHHHDEHEHHHDEHEHHHGEHCSCGCHDGHHHHHADDVFVSWGIQTTHKYTIDEIKACLEDIMETSDYGTVLRAKGIVPAIDGKWIHFDYVPGEPEVRYGAADVTGKICVIGSNLNNHKLEQLFI